METVSKKHIIFYQTWCRIFELLSNQLCQHSQRGFSVRNSRRSLLPLPQTSSVVWCHQISGRVGFDAGILLLHLQNECHLERSGNQVLIQKACPICSVLFCKGLDSICESFAEVLHWVRMHIISGLSLCPCWIWPSMAELSLSRTHNSPNSSTFITVNVIKLWCLKVVLLLQDKRINMFYPCEHIIWLLSSPVYKLEAKILSIKTQHTILVFLTVKCYTQWLFNLLQMLLWNSFGLVFVHLSQLT